jgi:hypothetical protein
MHLINRKFMPQIDEVQLIPLLTYLATVGVDCVFQVRDSKFLTSHQAVDQEKVDGICGNKEALAKPLLVASHGMVLDGNHRGAAHKKLGTKNVPVIVVPLAYEDALLILAEAPESYAYGDGEEHPTTL